MMGVGMIVGPVIYGMLSRIDPTLRMMFGASAFVQMVNCVFVTCFMAETHSPSGDHVVLQSQKIHRNILNDINPFGWMRLFQDGRKLATLTLAAGLSYMAEYEKDVKAVYRQEILEWGPVQSARYLSIQGVVYFIGPQLAQ